MKNSVIRYEYSFFWSLNETLPGLNELIEPGAATRCCAELRWRARLVGAGAR